MVVVEESAIDCNDGEKEKINWNTNLFNSMRISKSKIVKLKTLFRRPGHFTRGSIVSCISECGNSETNQCIFKIFNSNKQMQTFRGRGQFLQYKASLEELMQKGEFFWLDVNGFYNEDIFLLRDTFQIHPLTLEDIQQFQTQEKVECFENYFSVTLQTIDSTLPHPENVTVTVIVYETYVLTLHNFACKALEQVEQALLKVHIPRPDWVLYLVSDFSTEAIEPMVKGLESEVDIIDELVCTLDDNDDNELLQRMHIASKTLSQLMQRLQSREKITNSLAGAGRNRMSIERDPNTKLYFRNILNDVMRFLSSVESSRAFLHGTESTYYAQLNMKLSLYQEEQTKIISRLAMTSFVFLPPTLIAAIMGQNILIPWWAGKTNVKGVWPFVWTCALCVILSALFGLYGRLKKIW